MAALQEASENWDDDFEFQIERRKMSTATIKSQATENWDDDFEEDSRQSPKKIIQTHQEESWDIDEDDDDDDDDDNDNDEDAELGFAEEDRTVTAKSRRAALARLSAPGYHYHPRSPTSSVFSVPNTVHTYSSTTHLRPTSAFALIPPSPPIHRERERRRLRKKSRPKPHNLFELTELPSGFTPGRLSFSDLDLPRPASELASRGPDSDLSSIRERPPLPIVDTSMRSSNGHPSIPPTPTKGAALLSRIGSVKKWSVRRKRGDSTTAPPDANEPSLEHQPSKWDPRRRKKGDSTAPADTIPLESRIEADTHLPRGGSTTPADVISSDHRKDSDPRLTPRASSSLSSYQQQQLSLPPVPSALPLPPSHIESSHPQLPGQPQRRTSSSNWFFRSASKSGNDTTNSESTPSSPSTRVVQSRRSGSRSRVENGREGYDRNGNPNGNGHGTEHGNTNRNGDSNNFYSAKASRTDLTERREGVSVSRKSSEKRKDSVIAPGVKNAKFPTLTPTTTPTKLVKRKSFGFVHLGRGFSGHEDGDRTLSETVGDKEGDGEQDRIGRRAELQKDKYAGLGLGRAGVDDDDGTPTNEARNRRRSLSRLLMDRDKVRVRGKERENEDSPQEEGTRSFMGSVRRLSLVSVGVVGKQHKKTKSSGGGFLASIPPVPPVLACTSQVSLRLPSTMATTTSGYSRYTSAHPSIVDLRRAASLSSPSAAVTTGSGDPTSSSATAVPLRSVSTPHNSRPSSISSSTKRRRRTLSSKSRPKPRKSEEASQDGVLKDSLDIQREREPLFYPSEPQTPTRHVSPSMVPTPLLPPIELHPPSPPRTTTTKKHIQRRSRAYTTNEFIEGVELESLVVTPSTSSSLVFFTPTSSLSRNNASGGAMGVGGILPLPSLSPSKLSPGKSPSQSQQSVSLGRSTIVNVDEAAALAGGGGSGGGGVAGGGGGGGVPRRNSLGDLKIPARISQAQVGLRRDLGMVREFASNVEQLKELRNTYHTLVVEVQALVDAHFQRVQRSPQPVEKSLPAVPHPYSFFKPRPKTRVRSNTTGSTTAPETVTTVDSMSSSSHMAYKHLVEAFLGINSKYRNSWECAELLIELGSGGDDGGGVVVGGSAPTSVSASVVQQNISSGNEGSEGKVFFGLKGRERAITLANEQQQQQQQPTTSPSSIHNEVQSQPSSANIVSITGSVSMQPGVSEAGGGGPPPSLSWRTSTGKHDLSQRQLVLLREMLNNTGGGGGGGGGDEEGLRPPSSHFSIPAGENPELRPSESSRPQFVNRDWRWGDARNSTITLEEQSSSGFGADSEGGRRRDRKLEKEKKRRSGRLGMNGIRDMLRSLKKGHVEELQAGGNSEVQSDHHHHHHHGRLPAVAHPMMHSTTSLSTECSIGSKNVHNQAQQQQNRLPTPPVPSQIRRRGRSSTGPESMGSNKGPSFSPSSFTASKASPRRPSLASIFRIGGGNNNNKLRPISPARLVYTGIGVEGSATLPSAFGASEHDLSAAQCSSATTGTGGEGSFSTGEEEEVDWDRMDSASDLDATPVKALGGGGVDGPYDVSATVRGRNRLKTQAADERNKAGGVSPYLQHQSWYESDQQHPPVPLLPASSSSTGLGGFLARHSIIPKRSFSGSRSSLWSSGAGDGQQQQQQLPSNVPSRLSRHSNFEEQQQQQPTNPVDVERTASLRMTSSKSNAQSKVANANSSALDTCSRPSSSRSTKFPKTKSGSVRSVHPYHSHPSGGGGGQPSSPLSPLPADPKLGMMMTPENIKPLLENAKEVHVKLHECIVEIRALIEDGTAAITC